MSQTLSCERRQGDLYKGIVCIGIAKALDIHSSNTPPFKEFIQLLTEHSLGANCWGYNRIFEGPCSCFHGVCQWGRWTVIKEINKIISDSDECYENKVEGMTGSLAGEAILSRGHRESFSEEANIWTKDLNVEKDPGQRSEERMFQIEATERQRFWENNIFGVFRG